MMPASGSESNCLANVSAWMLETSIQASVATLPSPRVEPEDQPPWEALGHSAEPVRVAKSLGAHDHTIEAGRQPGRDRRFVTQPAAELARNADAGDDLRDGLDVYRTARLGTVQIHQVDSLRPLGFPARRHRRWIIAEDRLLIEISLPKPDATPSSQVDRRDHLHHVHRRP